MNNDYNPTTLYIGIGIAIGIVIIGILILNWNEIVTIISTDGLLGE